MRERGRERERAFGFYIDVLDRPGLNQLCLLSSLYRHDITARHRQVAQLQEITERLGRCGYIFWGCLYRAHESCDDVVDDDDDDDDCLCLIHAICLRQEWKGHNMSIV